MPRSAQSPKLPAGAASFIRGSGETVLLAAETKCSDSDANKRPSSLFFPSCQVENLVKREAYTGANQKRKRKRNEPPINIRRSARMRPTSVGAGGDSQRPWRLRGRRHHIIPKRPLRRRRWRKDAPRRARRRRSCRWLQGGGTRRRGGPRRRAVPAGSQRFAPSFPASPEACWFHYLPLNQNQRSWCH